MVDDDDARAGESAEAAREPSGPRRSTYTPPPSGPSVPAPSADEPVEAMPDEFDDDALANALAADLTRITTNSIPVIVVENEPEPVPAPVEPSPPGTPPPWANAPAPLPELIVDQGSPRKPSRRSLPDDELLRTVDDAARESGDTLGAIERLESQLQLREVEAQEFREWESAMLATGTHEAIQAVEETRVEFTGIVPPPISSSPAPDAPPPAPETRVDAEFGPDIQEPVRVYPEVQLPAEPEVAVPVAEEPVQEDAVAPVEEAPEAQVDQEPEAQVEQEPESAQTSWWSDNDDSADVASPPGPEPEGVGLEVAEQDEGRVWSLDAEPAEASPLDAELTETPLDADQDGPPPLVEPPLLTTPPFIDGSLPSIPFPPPSIELETGSEAESGSEPAGAQPITLEPGFETSEDQEPEPQRDAEPETGTDPEVPETFTPVGAADTALDSGFSFHDLINEVDDELIEPVGTPEPDSADPPPLIDPLPILDGGQPIETGSVDVVEQEYEEEFPDDVDETDRADGLAMGAIPVDATGLAAMPEPVLAPSGPIATIRIPPGEQVLDGNEPIRQPVFSLEQSGLEPTPVENRVGRAARLFWLWFAANSSVISLSLGAILFSLGMSLRQAMIAALAGVAMSFLPLGLSTLAGKRSGQPTMVVSRATFGLLGNILPTALALLTRAFWGSALLWLLAMSTGAIIDGAQLGGPFDETGVTMLALGVALLLAVTVAYFGYSLVARMQLVLSMLSGVLVVGFVALTADYVDITAALSTQDGSWTLAVTGAVLVFSFVGLVWANSGGDIARYQRVGSSGASSMLWATFGATLPAFGLIAYGALLAASNRGLAIGLLSNPVETLALLLPLWYPIPLLAVTGLSLLSGVILTIYSGAFALKALGLAVERHWSTVIVGAIVLALSLLLMFGGTTGFDGLLRDVATTLAVPTAAWAGIFAAEIMIRKRRFETGSLLARGGVYPDVNWVNLASFVVISAIGFGLTSATVSWLGWQGYVFSLFGVDPAGELAATDLGVFVALLLGVLVPIVAGIPAIRRQEATRV